MKALLVHKLFSLPPCSSLFYTLRNYAGETPYRSQHEVAHCPAKSTLLFFFPCFFNDNAENKCAWDISSNAPNRSAAIKHGYLMLNKR